MPNIANKSYIIENRFISLLCWLVLFDFKCSFYVLENLNVLTVKAKEEGKLEKLSSTHTNLFLLTGEKNLKFMQKTY